MTSTPASTGSDALGLSERCAGTATRLAEAFFARHAADGHLPRLFAGHPVGADVRADVCFTLGLLRQLGVSSLAGHALDELLGRLLADVDGARTHTFYSYRIAETAARLGLGPDLPANLAEAADSTAARAGLDDGTVPRNYAAVLARCEVARARLGLIGDDDPGVVELLGRTTALLGANSRGYLDDSRSDIARYDIYTADIYLFTEPFADRLGEVWERGASAAVDLVARIAARNGAAFPWGRSTGALGVALTVELAGLVAHRRLGADLGPWLARGANALDHLEGWFSDEDGVIRAHQHRSTYDYRGPFRRLQMTFDVLGKLADSALALRAGATTGAPPVLASPVAAAFPPRDELVVLDPDRGAALWAHRSHGLAFTLPLVGATVSDYLPGPRQPGLFETPVDCGLVVGVPFAIRSGRTYAPALPPTALELTRGVVTVEHHTFHHTGHLELGPDHRTLDGAGRRARLRVDGRTLHVEEELTFSGVLPHAVGLQVAEAAGRPLRVEVVATDVEPRGGATRAGPAVRTSVIDTGGIKEWRSFWGELAVVHQADIEPAPRIRFRWSVTPKLRVLSTAHDHHYHRTLYDPIQDDVVDARFPPGRMFDLAALRATLDQADIFHLHWPEWLFGADLHRHRLLIDELRRARVGIVWTQHNLGPHDGDPSTAPAYRLWAEAADVVLHHSRWGQDRVQEQLSFRAEARHAIVAHPHFGHLAQRSAHERARVESELGLRPGALRLGVVGAPRPGKDVEAVMRAVARCARTDIELLVLSLGGGEEVPDDPRIHARPYEMVARPEYEARLSAIDVLVLPFASDRMLTTGTVGDVLAHGIPAIASSWPFLTETLGEAAIVYDGTEDGLLAVIEALDDDTLDRAGAASAARAPEVAASAVAARLLAVLEELGTDKL